MPEDDELSLIRKKKLQEMMKRQSEKMLPKRAFVGAPPSVEALRQAVRS
jgi:hypothetical protein